MIPRVHILQKPGGREGRIRRNYQQTLQMPSLMAPGCSRLRKNIVKSPNNWGKYKKDMRWVTTKSEDSREGGRRGWGVAPIWYWEPRRSREIELHCSWFAGITPFPIGQNPLFFSTKVRVRYRVSLKKGTFVIFCLISVLEVGFYFFTCVSESEFQTRFI